MEEIYRSLAKELGISQEKVRKVIKLFFEKAGDKVAKGERVVVPGYISLVKVKRAGRIGVNPRTKEKMKIPPKVVIKAKAGKKLQEKL